MGLFTFHPLATQKGHFLELVERVKLGQQTLLMASPLRALMDLVCFKKLEWQGLGWFEHSMRIDEERLAGVTATELHTLKQVYKHKRMQQYLEAFEFNEELFSHTWIFGAWKGALLFWEPMITRDFLMSALNTFYDIPFPAQHRRPVTILQSTESSIC